MDTDTEPDVFDAMSPAAEGESTEFFFMTLLTRRTAKAEALRCGVQSAFTSRDSGDAEQRDQQSPDITGGSCES